MRTAFAWMVRSIAGSLGALILAQLLLISLGLPLALNAYSGYTQREFERLASEIIAGNQEARDRAQSLDAPFFVFSADRNLVFSNRGMGKGLGDADLAPVYYDQVTVGYYRAEGLRFLDSQANRLFFTTLILLLGTSLVVSSGMGLFFAYRAAGNISRPVGELLGDLRELERFRVVGSRGFDIRELTDISERITRVSEILSRQDSYKKKWMQDISHDLRTPIAGLRGQLEGLRDGVFTPSAERYSRLLSEIERLESMAAGVSELYYLENGANLAVTTIDSKAFVEETLRPFESAVSANAVRVTQDILVPAVRGDRQLLLRAAGNIVSNALRFVPPGGLLALRVEEEESGWALRVFNEGPEIPEEQIGRIFDRFYRGERSRTTPGSGLGLNIVQEIARRHGGRVRAENCGAETGEARSGESRPTGVAFTLSVPWRR